MRRNGTHREFRQQVPELMIPISQGTARPLQPFDFGLSCSIYTRFEEWSHTAFLDGVLYKCFEEEGTPYLLEVSEQVGQIDARLFRQDSEPSSGSGSPQVLSRNSETREPSSDTSACDLAAWVLSSDLDLGPLYEVEDPTFAPLAERFCGLKPPRTATVFEALVIAIIEQQIGLQVANVLQNRLVVRLGPAVKFADLEFHAFPSPERLACLEPQDLRDLGLSMNKSRFILGIAEGALSGELDLESLKKSATEEAREVLVSIKGVGRWTADYVLVRGLGRFEAVPYDDLGIRDAVGLFYKGGERATAREVEEILSRFGELAGVAAYYLLFSRFSGGR
jgi:DNA-3-methyladenine glycosylase II